VLHWGRG